MTGKVTSYNTSPKVVNALLFAFGIDKATLEPAHIAWLNANAVGILKGGGSMLVIGMASRSGGSAHNLGLSKRRTDAVVNHLKSQAGPAIKVAVQTATGEEAARFAGVKDKVESETWRAVLVSVWSQPSPPPAPSPPPTPAPAAPPPAPKVGRQQRSLTAGEQALLHPVFLGTLKLSTQQIAMNDSEVGGPDNSFTPGYIPNMAKNLWSLDYSLEPISWKATLIHEMTHVWQSSHGNNNVTDGIALWKKFASYDDAYWYDLSMSADFDDYNMEQQAALIEDYWLVSQSKLPIRNTGTRRSLSDYLPFVRQLQGAGSPKPPLTLRRHPDQEFGNKI
jgi:hypothetical protein